MEININKKKMIDALTLAESLGSVNNQSVLNNCKIETLEEDKICISATDLEVSIKTIIDTEVVKSGEIAMDKKQLNATLKLLSVEDAKLKLDDKLIILEGDRFRKQFTSLDTEFKTYEEIDMPGQFLIADFLTGFKKVSHSIASEDTRFVFNGLYVHTDNETTTFVGTDGRRLSKFTVDSKSVLDLKSNCIIPLKSINLLLKIFESAESETGIIGRSDNQLSFQIDDTILQTKLLDGVYPDYSVVIPNGLVNKAIINKNDFGSALRQAIISADLPAKRILLTFNKNSLNVYANIPGITEVSIDLDCECSIEEKLTIAVKGSYFIDCLRIIEGDIVINFDNSAERPILVNDTSQPNWLDVIMPMKL